MKLNTRSQYAVMALVDLASRQSEGVIPLKHMAEKQDLSVLYLEQLFRPLKNQGFVKSIRGVKGGYTLARPADQISVADIVHALKDPIKVTRCIGKGLPGTGCMKNKTLCATHHLWIDLEQHIWRYLSATTLQGIVDRYGTNVNDSRTPEQNASQTCDLKAETFLEVSPYEERSDASQS